MTWVTAPLWWQKRRPNPSHRKCLRQTCKNGWKQRAQLRTYKCESSGPGDDHPERPAPSDAVWQRLLLPRRLSAEQAIREAASEYRARRQPPPPPRDWVQCVQGDVCVYAEVIQRGVRPMATAAASSQKARHPQMWLRPLTLVWRRATHGDDSSASPAGESVALPATGLSDSGAHMTYEHDDCVVFHNAQGHLPDALVPEFVGEAHIPPETRVALDMYQVLSSGYGLHAVVSELMADEAQQAFRRWLHSIGRRCAEDKG
ncbi:hypothetical protein CDCA_CDCA08G2484 [Cyanidium caldarium]|uniref:Uncharacterized protein n=1 Tax=Cyanidium caldarium TaxID=2771 RepID=A0AAV9IVZ9_CYACA|nr:hypothetical protein CDCA_CDCA08G2484 [Cyanidium caldarium]|eukprot:ctg_2487.g556